MESTEQDDYSEGSSEEEELEVDFNRNEDEKLNEERRNTPPPTYHPMSWDLVGSVKMNDGIPVSKFRSLRTGFELIQAHVPGPLIHCYFVIPHKLEDDTGIPHILQHMIWQGGSKHYPYFGLFHHITNLCFSTGPQSWTELDHSCYHVTVAGVEGFSRLLPVVFDHLFAPTLQEASFLHKIYHIDGEGKEKGQCYLDVLQFEKDPGEIATLELIRKCFGEESNYRHTVYGSSKRLREMEMDMLDKMKEFHQKWYHLDNCCLVVCGDIGKEELFHLLDPIIGPFKYNKRENWRKPWVDEPTVSNVDPLMSRVAYPTTHHMESLQLAAVVKVGILGPPSGEKLNRIVAMRLVLEYLASGPLIDSFTKQKHRSSVVSLAIPDGMRQITTTLSVSEHEYKQTLFIVEFHNVPLEMISTVPTVMRRTLEHQLSGSFDFERMKKVVERVYEEEVIKMETHTHEKIVHAIIPDYLYREDNSNLMFDRRVNHAYTIDHFLNQPENFWEIVIEGILKMQWTTVGAVPSAKLLDEMKADEEKRVKNRMKQSNIKNTKKLAQRYKAAHKLYSMQPPQELYTMFPLPDVYSIGCTHIKRIDNPKWSREKTLCNLYVDDINSSFVFLTIIMDTSELTLEEKKHLVLFSEGILNSPFVDTEDRYHSAEDMKEMMNKDCIQYETFFGLEWLGKLEDRTKFSCGSFPHLFCLRFMLDVTKLREGFQWAHDLLWSTKWQAEKLRQTCLRLYREVEDELKGLGPVMTKAVLTDNLYLMNSNPKCISLIRQRAFLRRIGEDLPKGMRKVSQILESIRMTILRPENCTVHVAGSLKKMEFNLATEPNETSTTQSISALFGRTFDYTGWHWGYDTKRLSNAPDTKWMRSADCIAKCSREQILRMTLTEPQVDREIPEYTLGCLVQAAPCIRSWHDTDYPLILTALQYFIQKDGGPFQQEIIDAGLADDVDIRVSPTEGMIYFEMRYSQNLAEAYSKAYDIIASHCLSEPEIEQSSGGGDTSPDSLSPMASKAPGIWCKLLLYSAKSSMIFRLSLEESNPEYAAMLSLLSYYKGTPQLGTPRRNLMSKIAQVTMSQVQEATKKYLKPLFLEPCPAAASAPKQDAIPIIKELMERCGKRLTLIPPVEQSSLASYNQ